MSVRPAWPAWQAPTMPKTAVESAVGGSDVFDMLLLVLQTGKNKLTLVKQLRWFATNSQRKGLVGSHCWLLVGCLERS